MEALLNTLSSVGFDWHIALANFVNFLIVFVVLYKLVFKKLGATLTSRAKKIEAGLDDAAKGHHLLATAEEEKKKLIKEAEDKHLKIVEEAEVQADHLAKEIIHDAKSAAAALHAEVVQEKTHLKESVEKEFAQIAPSLVVSLFEKSLKSSMTKEANDAFVATVLK